MTEIHRAEMLYWRGVVRESISYVSWVHPDDALNALLRGTANQDYIDDDNRYAVLRWRELNKQSIPDSGINDHGEGVAAWENP